MPIEAVIWNLGGVLLRTEDRSRRLKWETELGLPVGGLDRLVFEGELGKAAALGKAQAADIWIAIRDQFDLSADEAKTIEDDFWAGDRVDQELMDLIKKIRVNYKTALLSNAWPDLRHALENLWKIADAFDLIVISAELGIAKPDPRIFTYTLDRLAVLPERAVFIDDFEENIAAAAALGFHTIHFTSPTETQTQLIAILGN